MKQEIKKQIMIYEETLLSSKYRLKNTEMYEKAFKNHKNQIARKLKNLPKWITTWIS